eukprot:3152934-Amphidinium_carterae.1
MKAPKLHELAARNYLPREPRVKRIAVVLGVLCAESTRGPMCGTGTASTALQRLCTCNFV